MNIPALLIMGHGESGAPGHLAADVFFRVVESRLQPSARGRNRPILLKKSTMVSAAEKYASEIEISTFGRGFRTQISRSSVQKRCFNQSMTRPFGRTNFFNRIGQKQTSRPDLMGVI